MTRANGNLVGEALRVGMAVVATVDLPSQYRLNTNQQYDVTAGDRFTITRVYTDTVIVRSERRYSVRVGYHQEQRQVSFSINRVYLMFEDPNYVPPPPPRKLGKTPTAEEAGLPEGVEVIGYDHPGIQWLFDDMGKYADQQGYCPQYDALCVKLGIPGRPRDFTVRTTVRGIQLSTTVKARSQREANDLVKAALAEPEAIEVVPEEPDFAPAA